MPTPTTKKDWNQIRRFIALALTERTVWIDLDRSSKEPLCRPDRKSFGSGGLGVVLDDGLYYWVAYRERARYPHISVIDVDDATGWWRIARRGKSLDQFLAHPGIKRVLSILKREIKRQNLVAIENTELYRMRAWYYRLYRKWKFLRRKVKTSEGRERARWFAKWRRFCARANAIVKANGGTWEYEPRLPKPRKLSFEERAAREMADQAKAARRSGRRRTIKQKDLVEILLSATEEGERHAVESSAT